MRTVQGLGRFPDRGGVGRVPLQRSSRQNFGSPFSLGLAGTLPGPGWVSLGPGLALVHLGNCSTISRMTRVLQVRVTEVELEVLRGRAAEAKVTVSQWVRRQLGLAHRKEGRPNAKSQDVAGAADSGGVGPVVRGGQDARPAGVKARARTSERRGRSQVRVAVPAPKSKHWAANLMPPPALPTRLCVRCTRLGRASCGECRGDQ
jgi:hypothetical protein